MYFWHFLAIVSCRISRASGGFTPSTPHQGSVLDLLGGSKRLPPDPQLQGDHCMLCLLHNIHTHVIYKQQTQGKTYQFWWENSEKNGWKSSKTQGTWCWKFCTNPAICLRLQLHGAIYRPDSSVLMLRYFANLKAIRYESTSFNRIVADKSHHVIAA